jgi:hypothetical protein
MAEEAVDVDSRDRKCRQQKRGGTVEEGQRKKQRTSEQPVYKESRSRGQTDPDSDDDLVFGDEQTLMEMASQLAQPGESISDVMTRLLTSALQDQTRQRSSSSSSSSRSTRRKR